MTASGGYDGSGPISRSAGAGDDTRGDAHHDAHGDAHDDAQHDAALRRIRRFLKKDGASAEEIERAEREDVLDLLVADRLLVPSRARYDETEVAAITGMPVEVNRRLWRALGFPDPTPGEKMFTDLDVEALKHLDAMVELGVADVDTFIQLARVAGSSMARIADAEVSPTMLGILALSGSGDSVEVADRFARVADKMLPATSQLLEFVWRRHAQAAVRRAMTHRVRGLSSSQPELCVGFADMVGFTLLSQQLAEDELAALVSRFEDVAHDVVTSRGGRLVKMIGDEAMFVTDSPAQGANIGLALAERYADDDLLSDVRVAMAVGPVLVQDGDYYGPVVNLANRVVDIAEPGSVLVTDELHQALLDDLSGDEPAAEVSAEGHPGQGEEEEEEEGFAFSALRPRLIKGVGRVQLWSLYRPGAGPQRLESRLTRRWQRLSEVLRELDELRERGEKLIASGLRVASGDLSGVGKPEGGDAEGSQGERPVEGGDRPASQTD